jgi:hypothetical protein
MNIILTLLPAMTGAIVGGIIGYLSSYLQWTRTLKRERAIYDRENLRNLAEAAYAAIEFMRDCYSNSQTMEINAYKACMSGKNPLKRILAIVATSVPDIRSDVETLTAAMDSLLGPEYPIPKAKLEESLTKANQFGAKVLQVLKQRGGLISTPRLNEKSK